MLVEILDGKGPRAQAAEYRRPKAELEATKAERQRYEEAAWQRDRHERQPQNIFWGVHTGSGAESGWRPEPTPRAYRRKRSTGQAPCYVVKRTVSPIRAHSPVGYRQVPCETRHPARACCAIPACLVSSTPFRSRVSCTGAACCVSRALGGCSAFYACAPPVPGDCGY